MGSTELERIVIEGSPQELGHSHGEILRTRIQYMYDERLDLALSTSPEMGKATIQRVCESLWQYASERYVKLGVELSATAQASNLAPWQLILAGGVTDVIDLATPRPNPLHECTVSIDPRKDFIGGTWDSHPSAIEGLVLLHRKPKSGPHSLALTTAGWPAQQGVNSSGLAFATTNLTPVARSRQGLVYIASLAILARLSCVRDVIAFVEAETFCSGHSYLALDSSGDAAIADTTGAKSEVHPILSQTVKANHYEATSSIDDNTSYAYLAGSQARQAEMTSVFRYVRDPSSFRAALAGNDLLNRKQEEQVATCAHFFISARSQTIWYGLGPPDSHVERSSELLKAELG